MATSSEVSQLQHGYYRQPQIESAKTKEEFFNKENVVLFINTAARSIFSKVVADQGAIVGIEFRKRYWSKLTIYDHDNNIEYWSHIVFTKAKEVADIQIPSEFNRDEINKQIAQSISEKLNQLFEDYHIPRESENNIRLTSGIRIFYPRRGNITRSDFRFESLPCFGKCSKTV